MNEPLTDAPRLTTDRLVLRGPQVDDLASLTRFTTTSARMGLLGGNGNEAEARFAFLTNIGRWRMDGMGFFTVTLQADPAPLGRVGLLYYPSSSVRDTAEVEAAWFLYDGVEGHGYATEAARAAMDWGYGHLGLHRIVSYILPENARSRATAQRLGATTDGSRAAHDDTHEIWVHPKVAA